LLTHKFLYKKGKLEKLESYYDPSHIFKNFRNKLVLEFNEELPYSGEVIMDSYGIEYSRVKKGKVIQKLKNKYDTFYEITPERVTQKSLVDRNVNTYTDYFQRIDFIKDKYKYTAISPDGKEHEAVFNGIKMKKGVFYLEKGYDGLYTIIVKDKIVYMVDKYIAPNSFSPSLAIKQIPVSSSLEEFEKFYDFYSFSNPIQLDHDDYGDLELNFR